VEAEARGEADKAVVNVAEVVDREPVPHADVRARSVSTDIMTTLSCRTWLRSTLARNASGVVCGLAFRNTAVPATPATGGSSARSLRTKSRSDPSLRVRFSITSSWPRRQVVSTMKLARPITSGIQPPCTTLVRLAEKNATSTPRNTAAPSAIHLLGARQSTRATTRNRVVVRTNVPETAIP
jgi:hypothetical protein